MIPTLSVAQKLFIKEGHTVLSIHAPKNYPALLGELPQDSKLMTKASARVDAIHFFAHSRKYLEAHAPKLKGQLKPNGLIWIMYHKGTSKVKTDVNRDTLHAYAKTIGLDGVSLISIDQDRSAMRFKVM
ncbi:MAG TPA: hypothetical protein VFF70_08680 [Anaerolineae bacterium]|nr:hypothetical protein [Anaerolineae bacterium]